MARKQKNGAQDFRRLFLRIAVETDRFSIERRYPPRKPRTLESCDLPEKSRPRDLHLRIFNSPAEVDALCTLTYCEYFALGDATYLM